MRTCDEKVECPICGRKITKINITKHIRSHETRPEYQERLLKAQHLDMTPILDYVISKCGKNYVDLYDKRV